jgi:hypothetical protein
MNDFDRVGNPKSARNGQKEQDLTGEKGMLERRDSNEMSFSTFSAVCGARLYEDLLGRGQGERRSPLERFQRERGLESRAGQPAGARAPLA